LAQYIASKVSWTPSERPHRRLSGSVKSPRFDHDICVPIRGEDVRIEAKRRARAFGTIDSMLGGNFAVVFRDDRSRVMVAMTLASFAKLAR
jgi:hypothetical protein